MHAKNYATLRDLILNAKDLRKPWDYFLRHIGNDPRLFHQSKRVSSTPLSPLLSQIGEMTLGKAITEEPIHTMNVEEHGFFHGLVMLGPGMLSFIYFRELDAGLVAAAIPGNPEVQFARLRCIAVIGDGLPMATAPGEQLIH